MSDFVEFIGIELSYEDAELGPHIVRRADILRILLRPDGYWLETSRGTFSIHPDERDRLAGALL